VTKPPVERAVPPRCWPFWVSACERPAGYWSPAVTTLALGCFWKMPMALACDHASACGLLLLFVVVGVGELCCENLRVKVCAQG
jgi:hypothetical protein